MTTRIAIFLLVLCLAASVRLVAQASDCNDPHASPEANAMAQREWESGNSPVYVDATKLSRNLAARGITVECIRRSKEEHLFGGQKGAAWFKTNQGIFEVWFMLDPEEAAAAVAKVTAKPAPISLPSGPDQFFIQYQNLVFHISMGDKTLAAGIQTAFQKP
jgi:hypothetical protein